MSSPNKPVNQLKHKHQNIVKPFFFSDRIYKYQKTTQISTKVFQRFLRSLFQLCRSRFHLIILEEKFKTTEIEKELLRTQSSIQKMEGRVSLSTAKYKILHIADKRKNFQIITYSLCYSISKLKIYLKLYYSLPNQT